VGLVLVALWAGAPMAIVLTMPYTEGLFVALAAWALVGVLEQKWWLAGVCTVFAGLVRSIALALIAVVVVAAGIAVFRGWPWPLAGRRSLVYWLPRWGCSDIGVCGCPHWQSHRVAGHRAARLNVRWLR
jgi:hypothetical protein